MQYFKGYKLKTLLGVLAKVLEAIFELLMPLIMVTLIDQGILMNNYEVVFLSTLKMLGLTILGYATTLVCQYYAAVVSQNVGGRIRSRLFSHIMTFSLADTDAFSSATLTNRLTNDIYQIQTMINMVIRLAIRAPFLMIGSLIAMNSVSPILAMRLLLFFPLFVIVVVCFMFLSLRYYKQAQAGLDRLIRKVREMLSGVRVIRAFAKADYETKQFQKLNQDLQSQQRKAGFITALSSPTITLLMNMVLVYLVYLGALEINQGLMTQGELVAIINYCTQLVLTLIVFTNIIMIYSRGAVSMKRVQEVLAHETTILDQGTQTVAKGAIALTFEHVNFSYGNQKRHVLKDISFSLQKGEVLGIIGLTGSGKSSLVSLIPRLYDVKSGQILINEQPIQTYALENLREHIGYVAQKPEFLEGSLARNVLMLQTGNAGVYLDDAQGADIVAKGLTTPIYEGGTNLSGGQRQRVNIARALAKQPGLLIFDDSFSALDPLTEKHLQATINDKYQGVTQILISQKTTTLQHADKIMVLDEGKMVALDTHVGLLEKNMMYREIHELQTGEGWR